MFNLAIKNFLTLAIPNGKKIHSGWDCSNLTYKFKTDLVVGDYFLWDHLGLGSILNILSGYTRNQFSTALFVLQLLLKV